MRKAINLIVSVLLLGMCLSPGVVRAQGSPAPDKYAERVRRFEEFVNTQMARDRIPGLTIGFFKDDYTWVKGFGYADLENKTPAQAESAYRLASITKTMTGAAIVQLAERGKLDLDAEIQTYVPYYPKQKWPVTVRQLLTHTGGGQTGSGVGAEHVTPRDVVARIAKYPIETEPGTKYLYTTSGYNLLGSAIEEITGQPLGNYLRDNLWLPLGMKDTRMDDVRALIPNRVRGYDLADGEVKNAPFVDVSTRFGGGGATGTVPDLLRWARGILSGKVLSPRALDVMLAPAATKAGRYSGLDDGDKYYTLGWIVFPLNGEYVIHNSGSQKGTDTTLYYFPDKHLAIAYAANLEFSPNVRYVARLYELLTDESWEFRVYTKDKPDELIYKGLSNTFDYGALHFWQHRQPLTTNPQALAASFAYFNANVNRAALQADFQKTAQAINDGRHPVSGLHFVNVGSYMTARVLEKYGADRFQQYGALGALPFFADYIALYKTDPKIPQELRFTPAFEQLITKWHADWTRTWNDYTRHLQLNADSDFDAVGARLRQDFAGAEIYPDFSDSIQPIQSGLVAMKAGKLGIDLYPRSAALNFNWGFFLALTELNEEGRALIKQVAPVHESPVFYFKRALEGNPNGVARAQTFLGIARNWASRPEMTDRGVALLRAAVEVHPKEAALYDILGDFLLKQRQQTEAFAAYRQALALDPNLAKGLTTDEYIARKTFAPSPNGNTVFRLKGYPSANRVALAGTFNNWDATRTLFAKEGDEWVVRVELAPGKYLYKFVVDGNWITDSANTSTEADGQGNFNSVLVKPN